MTGYVYIRSEPGLWTVGWHDENGKFQPESDHPTPEEAAGRVAGLNGGGTVDMFALGALAAAWEAQADSLHRRANELGPCGAGEVHAAEAGVWRQAAAALREAARS
jgi:hypothetical protein